MGGLNPATSQNKMPGREGRASCSEQLGEKAYFFSAGAAGASAFGSSGL